MRIIKPTPDEIFQKFSENIGEIYTNEYMIDEKQNVINLIKRLEAGESTKPDELISLCKIALTAFDKAFFGKGTWW